MKSIAVEVAFLQNSVSIVALKLTLKQGKSYLRIIGQGGLLKSFTLAI